MPTCSDDGKHHQLARVSAAAITKVCKILIINDLFSFLTVIDVVDFLHCPMNNLVDDDALRICYVFISQYPKQPLQHGRDEDEGGTPSHHTAAGIIES